MTLAAPRAQNLLRPASLPPLSLPAMSQRPSILFACHDNSGLSLLAEAIVNHAHRQVRAFSAGINGSTAVDSAALGCLDAEGIPTDGLSSKPLELFGFSGAPRIDLVVSLVADAKERIERLTGTPRVAVETWTFEDLSGVTDPRRRRQAYGMVLPRLRAGIAALVAARSTPTFAAA